MRLAVITAILASVALAAAPAALADGDPASDVLVGRSLFNPIGSGVSRKSEVQLESVLAASQRAGFPIRVALIASASDLGTASTLWNRPPKDYAYYLWTELSLQYGGQILVVMPNGFGLYGPANRARAVTAPEVAVRAPAPGPGERLASSAIAAVPLLAAAAGHPIPASELAAAASRNSTAGEKSAATPDFSPAVVLALVLGTLLIAVAWWASLRARPLRVERRLGT